MRGAAGGGKEGTSPSGFGELGRKRRKQPRFAKSEGEEEKANWEGARRIERGEFGKQDWDSEGDLGERFSTPLHPAKAGGRRMTESARIASLALQVKVSTFKSIFLVLFLVRGGTRGLGFKAPRGCKSVCFSDDFRCVFY